MSKKMNNFHLIFYLFLVESIFLISTKCATSYFPLCEGDLEQDLYTNVFIPVGGDLHNCTVVAAVSTVLNFRCAKPQPYEDNMYSVVWYITINGERQVAGLSLQTGSLDFVLNIDSEYINQDVSVQCGICHYDPSQGATVCERLYIHDFYPIKLSDPISIMAFDSPNSLESEVSGLSVRLSWFTSSTPQDTGSGASYPAPNTPFTTTTTATYKVFIEAIKRNSTKAIFELLSSETLIDVRSCDLQGLAFADSYRWSVVKIIAGKASLKTYAEEEFQFDRTLPCEEGDTRVVDGANCNEGRVELCLANNTWGTVCDDFWDEVNSNIVCDSLGIPGVAVARFFGPGEDDEPIVLDDVNCHGNETNLLECPRGSFLNCRHFEDIGVACGLSPQCEDGDIRLIDGDALNTGRVEVCRLRVWGTVCDDGFEIEDARVACRQLGFKDALTFIDRARFGTGSGSIVLDELMCTGEESSLFDCPSVDFHDCDHFEDVSVVCEANCINGDVRLAAGGTKNDTGGSGLIEVCLDGGWGFLYDSSWSDEDAMVICNQLKIDITGVSAIYGAGFQLSKNITQSAFVHFYQVECIGTETRIQECDLIKKRIHSQGYVADIVGVMCQVTLQDDDVEATPSMIAVPTIDELSTTVLIAGGIGVLLLFTFLNIAVLGIAVCLIYRKKNKKSSNSRPHPTPTHTSSPAPSPSSRHPQTHPISINPNTTTPLHHNVGPSSPRKNNYTDTTIDSGIVTTVFGSTDGGSGLEDEDSDNAEYIIILGNGDHSGDIPTDNNDAVEYATLRTFHNNADSAETWTGTEDNDGVYSVPSEIRNNNTDTAADCDNTGPRVSRAIPRLPHQGSTQSTTISIASDGGGSGDDTRLVQPREGRPTRVHKDNHLYSYPVDTIAERKVVQGDNTEQSRRGSTPQTAGVDGAGAGHSAVMNQLQSALNHSRSNSTDSTNPVTDILMVQNNAYDVRRSSTDSTGRLLNDNVAPSPLGRKWSRDGEEVTTGDDPAVKGGQDEVEHHYYNQIQIMATPHR